MKSMCFVLVCFVGLCGLNGCSSKKYADAQSLSDEFVAATEAYVSAIEKATQASDAADAINQYADKLESLMPKMKQLREKYPELMDVNNPPEALKESQAAQEAVSKKMVSAMMKMMPYMSDPDVQEAQLRMQAAMANAQ